MFILIVVAGLAKTLFDTMFNYGAFSMVIGPCTMTTKHMTVHMLACGNS